MKKILIFLLLAHSSIVFAQLGLKVSNIRPTGRLGAAQKPALGYELHYKSFFDETEPSGFNVRFSGGFVRFKTRQDTLPTYGVIVSSGTTVTPGWTVIHKYDVLSLNMGFDYSFLIGEKLYLYPGLDVGALFTAVEYESYAPLISSEGYSGGYVFLNTRFRIGAEYLLTEKFSVFAECNRSMNYSPEVGGLAFNDYGIGARINF